MLPPNRKDEAARIDSLKKLNILDTLPEEAYDNIAYLASQIADTPIALVSLIDSRRQWFKSHVGLEVKETPREYAFCTYAILSPERMLIVPDATRDERFKSNPLVTGEPEIRFYAGSPLVLSNGMPMGTLCVIDRKARSLTEGQLRGLQILSEQVVAQLELRRALAAVKQLSGLLPICAHCKSVRDDTGYWQAVECYIADHSDAKFTHGICPSCTEKHFRID